MMTDTELEQHLVGVFTQMAEDDQPIEDQVRNLLEQNLKAYTGSTPWPAYGPHTAVVGTLAQAYAALRLNHILTTIIMTLDAR
jgi:hypothetical protein